MHDLRGPRYAPDCRPLPLLGGFRDRSPLLPFRHNRESLSPRSFHGYRNRSPLGLYPSRSPPPDRRHRPYLAPPRRPQTPPHGFRGRSPPPKAPPAPKRVVERRRSGTVVNYSADEGYGFLTVHVAQGRPRHDANLFVHHSGLRRASPAPAPGQLVRFDVASGRKGLEAVNVRPHRLQCEWEDSESASDVSSAEEETPEAEDRRCVHGKVVEFNAAKGFGIVRRCDTAGTILAHCANFRAPLKRLSPGQAVQFDVERGPSGRPTAVHLHLSRA